MQERKPHYPMDTNLLAYEHKEVGKEISLQLTCLCIEAAT
ncbi:hypothetical protein CP10743SC13_0440 [Chlamydia psittaci 10_743_SC13]|nr:hypothetical protein CP10743SC13_0440 [Chlamydia psittaci 10_743_SC13]